MISLSTAFRTQAVQFGNTLQSGSLPGEVRFIRGRLLAAGVSALGGFAALAWLVHGNPGPLLGDVEIERFVQSIPWGWLAVVFGSATAFSGATQATAGIILLALVIVIRPRAFLFSVLGSLSGLLYTLTNAAIDRPRPSPGLVHVTEHLGAHSFPSGHAVFAVTYATLLVLCIGGKYLRRRPLIAVSILAAVVVAFMSIARLATGGHWPTDVYGGLLLAGGWILVLLSVRPIGNPVLAWLGDPAAG